MPGTRRREIDPIRPINAGDSRGFLVAAADMSRPKKFSPENLDGWHRLPNFFVVRNERRQEDNMTNRGRAIDDNVYDLNAIIL